MGSDPGSLPDRCVDLSHCHVMWESIGKRGKDCTIRFISDVTDLVSIKRAKHSLILAWYNGTAEPQL